METSTAPTSQPVLPAALTLGPVHLRVTDLDRSVSFYESAIGLQLLAAPTLVKLAPLPLRRLIGDLGNEERVLAGLDLITHPTPGSSE